MILKGNCRVCIALTLFLFLFFLGGALTQDLVSTGIIINTTITMLFLLLLIPATIAILLSLSFNHHHCLFGSDRD